MKSINKSLITTVFGLAAGVAMAGTDYFYVMSTPVGGIAGNVKFDLTVFSPDLYNRPIWSVDNATAAMNPAFNQDGVAFSGWNLGDVTGLAVPSPLENYQRSKPGASYGGTAVSAHDVLDGGVVSPRYGAMLNAYNLPWNQRTENGVPVFNADGTPVGHHRNIMGGNLDYAFSQDVDHRPFGRGPTSKFNFSLMLQVPTAHTAGKARAHVGPSFTLEEKTGSQSRYIWFGVWAFDFPSGGEPPAPIQSIARDEATESPIIGTSFNPGTTYSTTEPGSAFSTNQPWTGWRWFSLSVSYAQAQAALHSLNSAISADPSCAAPATTPALIKKCTPWSTNPADYRLGLVHLDGEVARSSPGSGGAMGYSTYGWWVYSTY